MSRAEMHVVISGPCFGCDQEMNRYRAGVLFRRPITRSDGGAAALCSACLDRAAGMILRHWDRRAEPPAAGGSDEPGGER